MSKLNKSNSGTPTNTLFKYFAKSPAPDKKKIPKTPSGDDSVKKEVEKENLENGKNDMPPPSKDEQSKTKRKLDTELKNSKHEESDKEEEEEFNGKNKRKRARIIQEYSEDEEEEEEADDFSDDGDDDYVPNEKEAQEESYNDDNESSGEDEAEMDESMSTDDDPTPKKSRKSKTKTSNNNNNTEPVKKRAKIEAPIEGTFMEKLKHLQAQATGDNSNAENDKKYDEIVTTSSTLDEPVVWPHQKLDFLQPDKIKDKEGRRPDHPDYDKSTLFVPTTFLNSLSPGIRQWWVLKADNFDCVLFFKVGKFYEFYHMDADVGVNELGFTYMRGEFAHSGFPEISFDKMASVLVDRGYKVARVEQTETPDMMTERCKQTKPTKFDKVVRREICQITNRGTQVFGTQCAITPNYQPNYMLAIVEKDEGTTSKYGVCYIDTSIGDFYLGEFNDDKNCSRLLTLLSHHMPVLLLSERASLSERTQQIARTVLGGILKELLPSNGPQHWTAEKTLKHLAEAYYAKSSPEDNWPLVLRTMQAESDHLGLTPADDYKLALKALGQCIFLLQKYKLEEKIMPMARYHLYIPPDMLDGVQQEATPTVKRLQRTHMVLDATTVANLRITGEEHSLQATLDNCCTKFGKRLLHHWLCAPSCDLSVIEARQRAISDLLAHSSELQEMRSLLAPLPDFERHLAQIHLFGNKSISENHPDGRAILFEEKCYNKKKLQNFVAILKGFETLTKLPLMLKDCDSELMKRLTQYSADGGAFPDLREELRFFENAFEHEEAIKTGVIAPQSGVDADYDEVTQRIADINDELKAYLIEQEKHFGCRIVYFGSDKKRFQLEVPESHVRKATKDYTLEGQRKGNKPCRRYTTQETRQFLKEMMNAEDARNAVLKDLARRIFEKFSNHYEKWQQCVDCVANLDVLGGLAEYARQQNVICVPELALPGNQSYIEIVDGYHPCVSADTYIPNGITLGTADIAPLSLLTGPNMGGKSTLMRQVGLLVVMAQIGAHVPAERCRLSIVDRIFTRLGAQDDILAGHSTFLVELNETSLILKHATAHSLVLLDELGRGTATYDGTAIAASVVNFLADLKCRTLFSTHYHNLIDFFNKDSRITLGHMACMVENDDNEDPTQETVTFLYKYTAGACPKSYGFNAAKLAGMPRPIIKRAYELSKKVEAIALQRKITAKIVAAAAGGGLSAGSAQCLTIKNLLKQLKTCQI